MSTFNLRSEYEAEVLHAIREKAKSQDKPWLPGKFFLVEFARHADTIRKGRQCWQREIRYALTRAHAIGKVRADNRPCDVKENAVQVFDYDAAVARMTAKTASLAGALKADDLAELRDDLTAYEATREQLTFPPPVHPVTARIYSEIARTHSPRPRVCTRPKMLLGEVGERLRAAGIEIDDAQLTSLLYRDDSVKTAAKPANDGKKRYSDSDLRIIQRHLTHVKPWWKAKPKMKTTDGEDATGAT